MHTSAAARRALEQLARRHQVTPQAVEAEPVRLDQLAVGRAVLAAGGARLLRAEDVAVGAPLVLALVLLLRRGRFRGWWARLVGAAEGVDAVLLFLLLPFVLLRAERFEFPGGSGGGLVVLGFGTGPLRGAAVVAVAASAVEADLGGYGGGGCRGRQTPKKEPEGVSRWDFAEAGAGSAAVASAADASAVVVYDGDGPGPGLLPWAFGLQRPISKVAIAGWTSRCGHELWVVARDDQPSEGVVEFVVVSLGWDLELRDTYDYRGRQVS
ncbi:hypothetical protein PG997_004842 [Apiospora hydei]|uniref:Uncharacterized protein n=1 Tax=Apiospora hydei TaxID=1337664 RepID=A0ABR1X3B9_9PEZI